MTKTTRSLKFDHRRENDLTTITFVAKTDNYDYETLTLTFKYTDDDLVSNLADIRGLLKDYIDAKDVGPVEITKWVVCPDIDTIQENAQRLPFPAKGSRRSGSIDIDHGSTAFDDCGDLTESGIMHYFGNCIYQAVKNTYPLIETGMKSMLRGYNHSFEWKDKRLVASFALDGEWRVNWIFNETEDVLTAIDSMDFTPVGVPKDMDGAVHIQCTDGHVIYRYAEPKDTALTMVDEYPYHLSADKVAKIKSILKTLAA